MEFGLCQLLLFNYFYVNGFFKLQKFEIDPSKPIFPKNDPIPPYSHRNLHDSATYVRLTFTKIWAN